MGVGRDRVVHREEKTREKEADAGYLELISTMALPGKPLLFGGDQRHRHPSVAAPDSYLTPSSGTTVLRAQLHTAPVLLMKAICADSYLPCLGRRRAPESQSTR